VKRITRDPDYGMLYDFTLPGPPLSPISVKVYVIIIAYWMYLQGPELKCHRHKISVTISASYTACSSAARQSTSLLVNFAVNQLTILCDANFSVFNACALFAALSKRPTVN
jgi:hypothetical protein